MEAGDDVLFTWRKIFVVAVSLLLIFFIWKLFFSYEDCGNWECFKENLGDCDRARYIGGDNMIFEYKILKKQDGMCVINVELLQGELNNEESTALERQQMVCELPIGLIATPGSDISKCTGELKEGLQTIVINRLHTYIVQNMGKINYDILDVPQ